MESKTNIQYIFDAHGKKTAVIVPISLWESMILQKDEEQFQLKRKKIESLFGILKNSSTLDEIDDYSRRTREGAFERI